MSGHLPSAGRQSAVRFVRLTATGLRPCRFPSNPNGPTNAGPAFWVNWRRSVGRAAELRSRLFPPPTDDAVLPLRTVRGRFLRAKPRVRLPLVVIFPAV